MQRVELQSHFIGGVMLVTDLPPGTLEPLLIRILADADPNLTVNSVRTMQQQVEFTFSQERSVSSLAGLFGTVALLLAAVGLHGITAYSVARRVGEIGIRIALGAARPKVLQVVLGQAFRRVLVGLLVGVRWLSEQGDCLQRSCTVLGSGSAPRSGRCASEMRVQRSFDSRRPSDQSRRWLRFGLNSFSSGLRGRRTSSLRGALAIDRYPACDFQDSAVSVCNLSKYSVFRSFPCIC